MTTPHRIEIHTPDHMLNDPAVRGGLYGVIISARLLERATRNAQRQLTRHAYPGQPSHRTQPTTADQVIKVAEQCGITLEPWQQRAIRSLYPTSPAQPCRCWYTAWCCSLVLDQAAVNNRRYCALTNHHHPATGFMINPHCPHHG